MRMTSHSVKVPTWSQTEYGEVNPNWSTAIIVPMFIGWTSGIHTNASGTIYEEYEFVGITKHNVKEGSLIDDKYVVGHVEKSGRFNRLFMNYGEGVEREWPATQTR